jgi:protein-S-isoprenylcysteine O-methyltransferase Ste14
MLKQSVITKSGQLWKLSVAVLALLVGSFAPLYPVTGISWTAGTVIAIVGYLFGMLAIRCKGCGKIWFWEAAKDPGLYGPLFKQPICPNCGQEFGVG